MTDSVLKQIVQLSAQSSAGQLRPILLKVVATKNLRVFVKLTDTFAALVPEKITSKTVTSISCCHHAMLVATNLL